MNFIKKIFDDAVDESVHLQFQKFSKGEFRNRGLIEARKTGKGYSIKTSAEFANGLLELLLRSWEKRMLGLQVRLCLRRI